MKFDIDKCPSDEDTFKNCLIVNETDATKLDPSFDPTHVRRTNVQVTVNGKSFIFALSVSSKMVGYCILAQG